VRAKIYLAVLSSLPLHFIALFLAVLWKLKNIRYEAAEAAAAIERSHVCACARSDCDYDDFHAYTKHNDLKFIPHWR
jgi:hypothetical protein